MKNIFVSSTFRDMQAERDLIQKEVLPNLRNQAKKYGENINMIDLRWGVDTSKLESDEGSMKVMSVCLDEVERSRPHMLIFLGERYGSIIDPRITERVIARKSSEFKLDDYAISITAMEVEFGALSAQFDSLENCVVCVRHFAPDTIDDGKERRVYSAEDAELEKKQIAFREKVINAVQGNVIHYTCEYDEQQKRLTNFKTLDGENLWYVLTSAYERMFKAEWKEYSELPWEEKEQLAVNALMESKLRTFKGRENLIEHYYKKIINEDGALILQGAAGSGKTSIMCKLMERLEQEGKSVFRFVSGNSSKSETALDLVQQMAYYLEELLDAEGKRPEKFRDWLKYIGKLINLLEENERVYFVIDALDQLHQEEVVKKLEFVLPDSRLRYVLSCTNEFEIPQGYNQEHLSVEAVKLLEMQDIETVAKGLLKASSRDAYDDMLAEIMTKKAARSPLYISILIQRLNMMGFDELYGAWSEQDIIQHGIEVIRGIPDETQEAAVFLLQEAVKRLDEKEQGLWDVINLIGVSRNGLRESDIMAITEEMGKKINQLDISRLIHYLDSFFMIHEDGRIDYTHKIIRKGIRENVNVKVYQKLIANRVKMLSYDDLFWKNEGMYYAGETEDVDFANEIFAYLQKGYFEDKLVLDAIKEEALADGGDFYCKNMKELEAANGFFVKKWRELFDIGKEETAVKERVSIRFAEWMNEEEEATQDKERLLAAAVSLGNVGNVMLEQGKAEEAEVYFRNALKKNLALYAREKNIHVQREQSVFYARIGAALSVQGKLEEAEDYVTKALEIAKKVEKTLAGKIFSDDLMAMHHLMGTIYHGQEKLMDAISHYEDSILLFKKVYKNNQELEKQAILAVFCADIGKAWLEFGDAQVALAYAKKLVEIREQICREEPNLQNKESLAKAYNVIAAVYGFGQGTECSEYIRKSITLMQEIYEASQSKQSQYSLSVLLMNSARVLREQGKIQEALVYAQNGLELSKNLYQGNATRQNLVDMAMGYECVASLMILQGRIDEGIGFYEEALNLVSRMAEDQDIKKFLGVVYSGMGKVLCENDLYKEGLENLETALAIRMSLLEIQPSIQNKFEVALTFSKAANAYSQQGSYADAMDYAKEAIEYITEVCEEVDSLKNLRQLAAQYHMLANILEKAGNPEEAFACYQKSQELLEEIENEDGIEETE